MGFIHLFFIYGSHNEEYIKQNKDYKQSNKLYASSLIGDQIMHVHTNIKIGIQ